MDKQLLKNFVLAATIIAVLAALAVGGLGIWLLVIAFMPNSSSAGGVLGLVALPVIAATSVPAIIAGLLFAYYGKLKRDLAALPPNSPAPVPSANTQPNTTSQSEPPKESQS